MDSKDQLKEREPFGQPTDDLSIRWEKEDLYSGEGLVSWLGAGRGGTGWGWGGGIIWNMPKPKFGINPVFDKLLFLHSFSAALLEYPVKPV